MKRDMDLVRDILLKIEEQPSPSFEGDLEITGYSPEEIQYHLLLLYEAGLISATDMSSSVDTYFIPQRLTWDGHEFLEAAKDDTRWNQAKDIMGQAGGFIYEVAKPLLVELAMKQVFSNLP